MRLLVFLLFCIMSLTALAQQPSFVVYYTKGLIGKVGTQGNLKKGDKLSSKEVINVNTGAQIILICSNYETVKLTAKGKYKVSDLLKQCDKKTASFASSYFSYVWKEFTSPHGSIDDDPTHYMKNTGAASRGCNTVEWNISVDTIIISLRDTTPFYYRTIIPKPYFTVFTDATALQPSYFYVLDTPLRFTGHFFNPEKAGSELEKPGVYHWQITDSLGQGCEPNYLQLLSKKEYAARINKILQNIPITSAAETAYMKAFILEENHFTGEAFKYYEQAYKLAPTIEKYKLARSRFYE